MNSKKLGTVKPSIAKKKIVMYIVGQVSAFLQT
jgi:hypothetical protein